MMTKAQKITHNTTRSIFTLETILREAGVNPDARFDRRLPKQARQRLTRDLRIVLEGLSTIEALCALLLLPSGNIRSFLGSSVKTMKSKKEGLDTRVMYGSPHVESGWLTCPDASGLSKVDGVVTVTPGVGCAGSCLIGSGQMVYDQSRRSRILKTAVIKLYPEVARVLLDREIKKHHRSVMRRNEREDTDVHTGIRLNGTTDINWTLVFPELFTQNPDVQFYDYTKAPIRARRKALTVPNYHLTYSLVSSDPAHVKRAADYMRAGINVAAVILNRAQVDRMLDAGSWLDRPVIDGDKSDARPFDPASGAWVLLYANGRFNPEDGFIIDADQPLTTTITA